MKPSNLFLLLIFSFGLSHCDRIEREEVRQIEGYWEIESVQTKGEVFQPKGNAPSVDYYFFSSDSTGFKKKLSPRVMGNYETSKDQVQFSVHEENGVMSFHFSTSLESWKEEIKSIAPERLILFHNGMEYHYKRHEKIAL